MKKIAFQGRKGAYSDCAAHYLFGEDIETLPMDTFEEIYQAIETGEADGGAIPIENSTAGSIEATTTCFTSGVTASLAKSCSASSTPFALCPA